LFCGLGFLLGFFVGGGGGVLGVLGGVWVGVLVGWGGVVFLLGVGVVLGGGGGCLVGKKSEPKPRSSGNRKGF